MKTKLLLCCFLFIPLLFISCDNDDSSEQLSFEVPEHVVFDTESFNENNSKWNELNLQNYTYEFGYSPQMDFKIDIKEGEVNMVEVIGSSVPNYLTIDQLFQEIKDAYPENGIIKLEEGDVSYLKEIKVLYNAEYYYPEEIEFVYGVTKPVEIDGFFVRFVGSFDVTE